MKPIEKPATAEVPAFQVPKWQNPKTLLAL
jgi:hypothetical protein